MIPINFKAYWNHERQIMIVSFESPPDTHWSEIKRGSVVPQKEQYVETFTLEQWNEYISTIDTRPLRLGGLEVNLTGSGRKKAEQAIKDYLKLVNKTFKETGQTDILG